MDLPQNFVFLALAAIGNWIKDGAASHFGGGRNEAWVLPSVATIGRTPKDDLDGGEDEKGRKNRETAR